MNRLIRQFQRHLRKQWIRGFRGDKCQPSVRAVLLGDFVSEIIVLDGEFEGAQLAAFESGLFPGLRRGDGGTAIDIGAHIGNHSVRFAEHFKRTVAFEPHPLTAHLLRANSFGKDIEVVELGLSAETGSMTLAGDAVSLGHSRIVPQSEGIEINVATLDQVAERLGLEDVRFVKIDVEGHEAEVLEGARATLARQLPILAIEMHGLIRQGVNEEVELILREIGYSHFYGLFIRHKESGSATDRLMRRATPKPLRSERQFAFVPLEKIPELDNRFVIASAKQLFERCISATRDSPRMVNRHSLGPQFFQA